MNPTRARHRGVALLASLGLAAAASLVAVPPAAAAPASDVFTTNLTASAQDMGGFSYTGIDLAGWTWTVNVTAKATWKASAQTAVSWESDDVRQGQTLDVSRVAPTTAGTIDVRWSVSGTVNPLGFGAIAFGPIPVSLDDVPCAPKLSGSGYTCTATSDTFDLIPVIGVSPYANVGLEATFDVTPEGLTTSRTVAIGGDAVAGPDTLDITSASASESFPLSCNAAPGESVTYGLSGTSWTPAVTVKQAVVLDFGIGVTNPFFPIGPEYIEGPSIFEGPIGPVKSSTPSFVLTAPDHLTDLGPLLKNNVLPTIDPIGSFSGDEGSPVTFSATVHSQCPIGSYVWEFSDGTKSFGPSPKRAFADDGSYDGQLTVTDVTGLSATSSFTVDIANVAPTADAGPDTSGEWGVPLAFTGQAVDPGSGDQATLTYSWGWGDATPATSGRLASHAYQTPGVYTATLTVCDDTTCVTDSAQVTVRKRETTTSYTGSNTGTYSASTTLAGSVVDEFGAPVSGASVAFTLAGASAGSATTGAGGTASRTAVVSLGAGSYGVSASYAGSPLYEPSSSATESFDVSRMATTVVYTGALTGGPNKTVTVSATLTDSLGRALVGKTVTFTLGTQTVSAVTGATGVATASIKLAQKNGKYPLKATYAGDASFYLGAVASATYSIQAK